eukprot:PITA_05585
MIDLIDTELSSIEEEVEKPIWIDAMVEEYESIVKNSVLEVVPIPVDKSVVGSRWMFKVRHATDRIIEKYKARFVAKVSYPIERIDYKETFASIASDEQLIRSCKEDLAREFEMKDMGLIHYFLGLEVWKGDGELFVSQGKYANEILQRFRMGSCKPMESPLTTNWKKEDATSGEEVDAIVYRLLVGLVIYLVNT